MLTLPQQFEQLVLHQMRAKASRTGDRDALLGTKQSRAPLGPLARKASELPMWESLNDAIQRGGYSFFSEMQKAAVSAGTTGDATWASPLVALATLQTAWFQSLRATSLLDALAELAYPAPTGVRISFTVASGVGHTVDEAMWTPLTALAFDVDPTRPRKALTLCVISKEALQVGGALADSLITAGLRRGVSVAADDTIINILTSGITPIGTTNDPRQDIRKLLTSVNLKQFSKPVFVTAPEVVTQLMMYGTNDNATLFPDLQFGGGSISGIPVIPTDAAAGFGSPAENLLMLVDAAKLGIDPGTVVFDSSDSASLQMTDTPANGAASLVSMFQTNSIALRGYRWFSLTRVDSDGAKPCAWIDGVNYSA